MKKNTINIIESNSKSQLIDQLVLKNIKGGTGCPPPIGSNLRGAGDPPPFGI